MDPLVEFVWSCTHHPPVVYEDWGAKLLEFGFESDAILRLSDPFIDRDLRRWLVPRALAEIGRADLSDPAVLRREYEAGSIVDYFAGKITGWTLIERGWELYFEDNENKDLLFWLGIGDEMDGFGQQHYSFARDKFDEYLRQEIRKSGRLEKLGIRV